MPFLRESLPHRQRLDEALQASSLCCAIWEWQRGATWHPEILFTATKSAFFILGYNITALLAYRQVDANQVASTANHLPEALTLRPEMINMRPLQKPDATGEEAPSETLRSHEVKSESSSRAGQVRPAQDSHCGAASISSERRSQAYTDVFTACFGRCPVLGCFPEAKALAQEFCIRCDSIAKV